MVTGPNWGRHIAAIHEGIPPPFEVSKKRAECEPLSSTTSSPIPPEAGKRSNKPRRDVAKRCRICRMVITGDHWKRHVARVHGGHARFKRVKAERQDLEPPSEGAGPPSGPITVEQGGIRDPLSHDESARMVVPFQKPLAGEQDSPLLAHRSSPVQDLLAAREDSHQLPHRLSPPQDFLAGQQDTPLLSHGAAHTQDPLAGKQDSSQPSPRPCPPPGFLAGQQDSPRLLPRPSPLPGFLAGQQDTPLLSHGGTHTQVLLAGQQDSPRPPPQLSPHQSPLAGKQDTPTLLPQPGQPQGLLPGQRDSLSTQAPFQGKEVSNKRARDSEALPQATPKKTRCSYLSCRALCRGANTRCWKHNEARMASEKARVAAYRRKTHSVSTAVSRVPAKPIEPISRGTSERPSSPRGAIEDKEEPEDEDRGVVIRRVPISAKKVEAKKEGTSNVGPSRRMEAKEEETKRVAPAPIPKVEADTQTTKTKKTEIDRLLARLTKTLEKFRGNRTKATAALRKQVMAKPVGKEKRTNPVRIRLANESIQKIQPMKDE